MKVSKPASSWPLGVNPFSAAPGDFPEVRYDLDRIRTDIDRASLAHGPASMWRYAPMLPLADPANAVTLGEGWTPLLPVPALARELGLKKLWAKDEGRNPSGTFKDRGASCAVSRLRELGAGTIVHNSSGNAAGSWGLYAARGGLTCVNLLPGVTSVRERWMWTTFVELVVDGDVVDLNRIPLPPDAPIVDLRFGPKRAAVDVRDIRDVKGADQAPTSAPASGR